MTYSRSIRVENLLARPEMHHKWKGDYRGSDNESFYEAAFDFIGGMFEPSPGATFLDVGCGSCAHSVRLARRGFDVRAVDFSESALGMAQEYVRSQGLEDRISLGRENLLELSFPDESFDYILCWGVLMHIPEVGGAISELARVIKPGGSLIISEGNQSSLEAALTRNLRRLLRREKAEVKRKPAGIEYWKEIGGDAIVTRTANIPWLVRTLEAEGLTLRKRVAGQFSESYTRVSGARLKRLIHAFNNFWFRRVSRPGPAFGNILIFEKQ